jgi:hypothetical protein
MAGSSMLPLAMSSGSEAAAVNRNTAPASGIRDRRAQGPALRRPVRRQDVHAAGGRAEQREVPMRRRHAGGQPCADAGTRPLTPCRSPLWRPTRATRQCCSASGSS